MTVLDIELQRRRAAADPQYLDRITDAAAQLERGGLLRGARRTGDRAVDFALDTPDGSPLVLSDLLRRGPVVISFHRGEWCAFCRAEIAALLAAAPDLAAVGASLLMILPDPPSPPLAADMERLGPRACLLHDERLGAALLYGVTYRVPETLRLFYIDRNPGLARLLGEASWLLPLPAVFVIGRDGTITLSYVDADFTRRLDPRVLVEHLTG